MAENQSLVQRVAIGAVACAAGALIGHLVTRTDQRTCSKAPYHSPASQALPPSASPPHAQHQSSSPRFAPGIQPLATAESPFLLDGETLTPEALVYLGYNMDAVIDLSPKAWFNVREGRAVVDNVLRRKEVVYGINTGFGNFANVIISDDNLAALQLNLIRSHAAGVGEPLSVQQTRMLLILRINVLAKGFSGIREETVRNMLAALNANCLSKVPAQGSVGASGDLAPLSHLALGLIGEGEMWDLRGGCEPDGSFMPRFLPAAEVLKAANVSHITLQAKEGLALINGTQLIASLGAEAVVRARLIAHQADCISALTLEALKGSATAFHPRIHNTRPHRGQLAVASRLRALLNFGGTASQISSSHYNCGKVQDSYTLRCIPQIHGICHDSVDFVYDILVTELNSATDNPMIFSHERRRAVTASPAVDIFRQYDSVGLAYKLGQHQPAKAAEAPLNAGALDPAAWANMSKDELVSVLKSVAAAVTPALGSASATDASLASDEAKHSGLRHSTSTDLLATMAGRVAEYAKGHHLKLTHGIATSPRSLQPDDDEGNDEGDKEANDPHHSHGGFGSVSLISDDDGQGDVNEGVILSGGNFHGEYPAKALDFLAIGVHELASVSERRIERLVNPALSGLPAFLVKEGGLNSGFMIAHCTAAALVSENKVLCHPSSVDSLSTSAAQEDHVSMGGWSARKALKVVAHVEQCLAIELLAACQAIEFLRPLKSTKPLEAMLALVRQHVPNWAADRHMSPDIDIVTRLLREGKVWQACAPFVSARH